jgi:hypothetical protein
VSEAKIVEYKDFKFKYKKYTKIGCGVKMPNEKIRFKGKPGSVCCPECRK